MKKAFTLLELVFVIIILGILAYLALSFTTNTKEEAKFLKLKLDYEILSSSLALMRNEAELKQVAHYTPSLDNAKFNISGEKLFYCENNQNCTYSLLNTPIYSDFNSWMKIAPNHYKFFLNSKKSVDLIYDDKSGILKCVSNEYCKELL